MEHDGTTCQRLGRRSTRVAAVVAVLLAGLFGVAGASRSAAADPPTLTVTPSTGLHTGDTVHVSVTGADPLQEIGVGQCLTGAGFDACSPAEIGSPQADGTYQVDVPVRAVATSGAACTPGACELVAVFYDGDHQQVRLAQPLTFDDPVAPTTVTLPDETRPDTPPVTITLPDETRPGTPPVAPAPPAAEPVDAQPTFTG